MREPNRNVVKDINRQTILSRGNMNASNHKCSTSLEVTEIQSKINNEIYFRYQIDKHLKSL